ncbi:serine/threonine kinase [Aureococcus anophagefferens]|nr:serine/threonine kinase [Aureococcus anophagefferens]
MLPCSRIKKRAGQKVRRDRAPIVLAAEERVRQREAVGPRRAGPGDREAAARDDELRAATRRRSAGRMSSFFEPATPVDGAREVRTPGTPVESPPEPAENSAMDSIYEFMSGLLGLGGAGGGGRAPAARGEPLERSTTRMRDALLARNKSVKSGPRRQRRDTELLKIPLKSVYDVREKIGNGPTAKRSLTPRPPGRDLGAASDGDGTPSGTQLNGKPRDGAGGKGTAGPRSAAEIDAALQKEIEILTNMHHPHIIELFDVFDDAPNDAVHIVMPLCRGGELFGRIGGGFSEVDAAVYSQQMLSALEYLHSQGIVHRDLKPENFMFLTEDEDSDLVLIDFGVSTFFRRGKPLDAALGTVYYTAPEVFDGEYDEKCDVWSIGIIIYMLLAGHAPFEDAKHREYKIVSAIRNKPPPFKDREWAGASPEAIAFLKRLLVKDPARRPGVTEALGDAWFKVENVSALVAYGEDIVLRLGRFQQMNAMKKVAHQMIATELTEAEIGHLQQQFRLLDTDGDGVITVGELMTAIAEIEATDSAGSSKALLRGLEASLSDSAHEDDAVLDIDEFIAATFRRHQGRKQKYSTRLQCHHTLLKEDSLKAAYEKFDVKGTGTITVEDLELAFGSKKHAQEVFDLVDANGDGEISFDEFREMMGLSPNEVSDAPHGGGHGPAGPAVGTTSRPRAQSAHARIKEHAAHERRKSIEAGKATPPRPSLASIKSAGSNSPAWNSSTGLDVEDPRGERRLKRLGESWRRRGGYPSFASALRALPLRGSGAA